MAALEPWWQAVPLRDEVRAAAGAIDDVQMSLYNAVYGETDARALYADPGYFGEITFPAENLVDLMAKIAVRLAGAAEPEEIYKRAPALRRLDQGMGGGKSHGLIGLWHLVEHAEALAKTEIGGKVFAAAAEIAGGPLPWDLNRPKVIVLSCDNMTAGRGDKIIDGPADSLYERFLWRLFDADHSRFQEYLGFYADKSKLHEALSSVRRPVLILVDEIMDYVRQLSESRHSDLRVQDLGFLRALFDTVNDVPNVAMVVVMIDSEKDTIALDEVGIANRAEIDDLLKRNGTPATVTSNTDFVDILRRRLFERLPSDSTIASTVTRFSDRMVGPWRDKVFDLLPRASVSDFASEVARCYPFHPALMQAVEQEWAPLAGYQKVRSTIRIFAATAYAQAVRGEHGEWSPLLIGPGDLPLSNGTVREAIIGSGLIAESTIQANYRQVAAADIAGDGDSTGAARVLDLRRVDADMLYKASNPRAAERMATALFLYSVVGTRAQGKRGATEAELKAAAFVPDATFGLADADGVSAELRDPEEGLAALEYTPGKGGQPARLFLTTRQTLEMWRRSMRQGVTDADGDEELARAAERLMSSGPFKVARFVKAVSEEENRAAGRPIESALELLAEEGLDDARKTRLVVLDPRRFCFGNGIDDDTRGSIEAAFGLGETGLPVQWSASLVFAIVNTQRRRVARAAARDYVAWMRVCDLDAVDTDEDLRAQASEERAQARRAMDKTVKQAFQHFVYMAQDVKGANRSIRDHRFEQDNQTSLDGGLVWTQLVEEGRAVSPGAFSAKALLVNLDDGDYSRPLDEVRDRFWNSPRKALLPGGESDLQDALFWAITEGSVRLVTDAGAELVVTAPSDIGLSSSSARIALREGLEPEPGGNEPDAPPSPTPMPTPPGSSESDVQVGLSLVASLSDTAKREAVYAMLQALARAVDGDKVSHIQISARATLPESASRDIIARAEGAGANPNSTPI